MRRDADGSTAVDPGDSATRGTSAGRAVVWRRLGDLGLCVTLLLFGMMRVIATRDSLRADDWLAALHHGIVGISLFVMAALPIIRRPAVARGEGIVPKAVAVIGGYFVIPLGLLPLTWRPDWLLTVSTLGLVAMTAVEIWALLTLRRSFSVFPEARRLIVHGPYGYVRHPLYALYIGSYVLIALPRFSFLAIVFAGLGIAAQVMRSRREEDVLRAAFPEYDDYAVEVPAFFPRWRRRPSAPVPASEPATADGPDEALAA